MDDLKGSGIFVNATGAGASAEAEIGASGLLVECGSVTGRGSDEGKVKLAKLAQQLGKWSGEVMKRNPNVLVKVCTIIFSHPGEMEANDFTMCRA